MPTQADAGTLGADGSVPVPTQFETLVAAAAERKAAEQVQKLRATLEKLRTQNAELKQELDTMQEQHTMLQDKLHEAQVSSRGPYSVRLGCPVA